MYFHLTQVKSLGIVLALITLTSGVARSKPWIIRPCQEWRCLVAAKVLLEQ